MNVICLRNFVAASVATTLGLSFSAFCSYTPKPSDSQSVRTLADIRTVIVTVLDKETGAPVEDLSYRDFQVEDDGHPVTTALFVSASAHHLRPLTIWFLVSCVGQRGVTTGSRNMAGKSSPLGQALGSLDSDSTFGVAHWCGSGDAKIDLPPTQDRDAVMTAIDSALQPAPVDSAKRVGRHAFQRALDLITANARLETRPTWPVIIVLHDGGLDLPKGAADLAAKKLLYRGTIVYQISDGGEDTGRSSSRGRGSALGFICAQTGGRMVPVQRGDYGEAMTSIVHTLHSRYVLGVHPGSEDRQWHEIRVRLTDSALQTHKPVELEYGAGYLADFSFGASPPYSTSNYHRATNPQLDSDFISAIDSPNSTQDIRFEATPHGFTDEPNFSEFSLQLDTKEITWTTLPNGDQQSEISIVVASFSAGGQRLDDEIVQFEILRDEVHLPITGDGPFTYSVTEIIPRNAVRIRVAIRDAATGRVGVRDFSIEEISDAPKSPAVIR